MTDLEDHLASPDYLSGCDRVAKIIADNGVRYIYLQFVSVTGRVVGKGIPSTHWDSLSGNGIQMFYGATANVTANRDGRYLGYGCDSSELVALPDPETFAPLPWDNRVARVFARLFRNREERDEPGQALRSDARGNLARAHREFTARHDGLQLQVGTETEMMWLRTDADTKKLAGATKPYCYHIDQFEELRPILLRVLDYCDALGLDMIQGDHEDAPGQLELNFAFDDPLRNADRLITYRQICQQVGREFDIRPTFMAKPFQGVSASGCHHNLSLWRGRQAETPQRPGFGDAGRTVHTHDRYGTNTFLADDGGAGLTATARHSIGGILRHLPALTAIGCPTVNSYRRLWDTGFWAPVHADWGFQNRTCAVRVPSPGRIEYRGADSMTNPYLMASALLASIGDGLANDVDPGPPTTGNSTERDAPGIPMNLGAALDELAADEVVRESLPGDMYRVFVDLKQDEWQRFLATVTDWDLDTYLDYLP